MIAEKLKPQRTECKNKKTVHVRVWRRTTTSTGERRNEEWESIKDRNGVKESVCTEGEGGGGVAQSRVIAQNPSLWLIMANTSDHVYAVEKAGSSP